MRKGNQIKNPDPSLLKRIEELEALVEKQKRRRLKHAPAKPKATVEDIPVLYDVVTEQSLAAETNALRLAGNQADEKQIKAIMRRVDKEGGNDLEAFVKELKSSIINELKNDLIKELKPVRKE